MDEIVIRSMLKWPAVPAVYGWLMLDRRGNWLIKGPAGAFDRIANAAVVEFMGRNYARDEDGRYYFQNGPQRVFVTLEYTPWVFRLDDTEAAIVAHTGAAARRLNAAFVDESGALLLETEIGIGVLLDRDLAPLMERLRGAPGQSPEAVGEALARGETLECSLLGHPLRIGPISSQEVAQKFGFVRRPVPRAGEAEC